jgi:hypothetical protein
MICFILTHGRPNRQLTLQTLLDTGYTGEWYLVLDDQDSTIQEYIDNYGKDHIIVFDKNHYVSVADFGNREPVWGCALYARNAIEDIARDMGLDYYIMSDDDITKFRYRFLDNGSVKSVSVTNSIDEILNAFLTLLRTSGASAISPGIPQAFMQGKETYSPQNFYKLRKCYQFIFRDVSQQVKWRMPMYEDGVVSFDNNREGHLFLQIPYLQIDTVKLCTAKGGMHDAYRSSPEFNQCFHAKMCYPDAFEIKMYKDHFIASVNHGNSVPHIISDSFKLN